MRAPVAANAARLTAPQPCERAAAAEFEAAPPGLSGADVTALSFIEGLPRVEMYEALRGEPPPLAEGDGELRRSHAEAARKIGGAPKAGPNPADTPCIGVLDVLRDAAAGEEDRGKSPDCLEDLLFRLGCPEPLELAAWARQAADRAVLSARAKGIETVAWGDPRYPSLLSRIFDPPLVVWVRGCIDAMSGPCVAIVGSRACSVYGEQIANRLAEELAARGLVIVSGLARGIDGAAHRGVINGGGRTIAVLGCGVDVTYPPEHAELMSQVASNGAVISELPPGARPLPRNFPERNRIISGLSRAVIVVEARQRSGALITADCALEQGREVMAVPGNALSDRHRGSHSLLKAGAALVETAEDVLEVLKMGSSSGAWHESTAQQDPLLALMDSGEVYEIDALSAMCGEDVATLLPRLLRLELQGRIQRAPGGRFVRCQGNVLT